jgi:uncharacterized protein
VQVAPLNESHFDSLKLVQDQQVLSGTMPIAGFARLMESLQQGDGVLKYRVQGAEDGQQRPLVKLQVSGVLQLQCQRCLDGLAYTVNIDTALRLVAQEALDTAYDDNPDVPDCVAASAAFDLVALIEDEVLLALPAYPRHEAGRCSGVVSAAMEAADSAGVPEAKIRTFSALQALKDKLIQSKE